MAQRWATNDARKLSSAINSASIGLLREGLKKAADAPEEQLSAARAYAAGLWLGASEIVATNAARTKIVDAAFSGKPDRAAIITARDALENVTVD